MESKKHGAALPDTPRPDTLPPDTLPPDTPPRPEQPDPLRARSRWRSLNGWWDFCRDDEDMLRRRRRYIESLPPHQPYTEQILVPFSPQSARSGVKMAGDHPVLWYRRRFELSRAERSGRIILVLGAVDHSCDIWVNGQHVVHHRGGYTPIRVDITPQAAATNELELRAEDWPRRDQPRGKQSWQAPFGCWYTACSGIWQPVWLEFVGPHGVAALDCEAQLFHDAQTATHHGQIICRVHPVGSGGGTCRLRLRHDGQLIADKRVELAYPQTTVVIPVASPALWAPGQPALYDIEVETPAPDAPGPDAADGPPPQPDRLSTYVAFRSISVRDGMLAINGQPVFQCLVLDQGFWPDSTYTAAEDNDFRRDIESAQALGFIGCRKHAKIEDPRFLYWADRLGFLVWEELPPAYAFSEHSRHEVERITVEMLQRDRGHPSIVVWTLYNESWGIPDVRASRTQQEHVRWLVGLVRSLDPTRLIAATDGWEHVDGDIYGVHSYAASQEELAADLRSAFDWDPSGPVPEDAAITSHGKQVAARPGLPGDRLRLLSEFGGIGFQGTPDNAQSADAWGYHGIPSTPEEFHARLAGLMKAIAAETTPLQLAGIVYTQLTDVQQEINGLLTADRHPKLDPARIRRLFAAATDGSPTTFPQAPPRKHT